jgi:transcription antitermination factor NusG
MEDQIMSKEQYTGERSPSSIKPVDAITRNPQPATRNWFAFYTKPRNEKVVLERLLKQGFEAYLPLIKTLRIWSDRKKFVEVPLINSYIFVKTTSDKLYTINSVEGVSRYISFEGKPAAIPDKQIDYLRLIVDSNAEVTISGEKIEQGDPVEVIQGSLLGLRGEIVKITNKNRVVVRIDRLDLNLVLTIQKAFLKKIR